MNPKIIARLIALGTILSLSLAPFLVKAGMGNLHVNFPNGGESLEQGNVYPLQWLPIGNEAVLSLANSQNVFPIATVTGRAAESGVYLWTVPNDFPIGKDYRLIIESGVSLDVSDQALSIIKPIKTRQAKMNQLANIFQILENILSRFK